MMSFTKLALSTKRASIFLAYMSLAVFIPQASLSQGETLDPLRQSSRDLSSKVVRMVMPGNKQYLAKNGEQKTISVALQQVRDLLKDPDSAKFQKIRIRDYQGEVVVCGEVNAKNSYGGYAGYRLFIAGVSAANLEYTSGRSDPTFYADINHEMIVACGR
jgi:hypothetical protein